MPGTSSFDDVQFSLLPLIPSNAIRPPSLMLHLPPSNAGHVVQLNEVQPSISQSCMLSSSATFRSYPSKILEHVVELTA